MKVLVIGGAGYIGSTMVRALIEKGHAPAVFDDLSTGHRHFVPKNVPFVQGDLKNFKDIHGALKKHRVPAVMHFAASALVEESVKDPLKYYDNNVAAMVQLLKAMRAHGVERLIFSSTCATFGEPKRVPIREDDAQDPTNPYGRSKRMIEQLLKDCGEVSDFRYVILRYFNACGAHADGGIGERHKPETHLIPNILKTLTGEKKSSRSSAMIMIRRTGLVCGIMCISRISPRHIWQRWNFF